MFNIITLFMNYIKLLLITLFNTYSINIYGQHYYKVSQADSLKTVLTYQDDIEEINTLLHLAECYYYIQIDTALNYVDLAKKKSEVLAYSWGHYKSTYLEAKIKYQFLENSCLMESVTKTMKWFKENGYKEDYILCKILYIECLSRNKPIQYLEDLISSTLSEAKELQKPSLESKLWYILYRINGSKLITNYKETLDSTKNLAILGNDSLSLIQGQISSYLQDGSSTREHKERNRIVKIIKRWNNVYLLHEMYEVIARKHAVIQQHDSAMYYCNQSENLTLTYGSECAKADVNRMYGLVHHLNYTNRQAIPYVRKYKDIHTNLDSRYKLYNALKLLGMQYQLIQDDESSLKCYIKALNLAQQLEENSFINLTKVSLANLYSTTDEYLKAEELLLEAKEYVSHEMTGRMQNQFLGKINELLAKIHYNIKNYSYALNYYDSAFEYYESINSPHLYAMIQSKFAIHVKNNDIKSASSVYEYLKTENAFTRKKSITAFPLFEGEFFYKLKKYNKAITSLKQIINSPNLVFHSKTKLEASNFIYKSYEALGDYKKALEYHVLVKSINDSIQAENATENVALLQSKHEVLQQENELAQIKQEREVEQLVLKQQNAEIREQKQNIFILILGSLIVISWGLFLFYRYRIKQKNKTNLLEEEREKITHELELAELRTDFFTNVSHEFRTPLTLLISPLKRLSQQVSDEYKPTVDLAYRNANILNQLVDETLELSKLKKGHLKLNMSPCVIGNILMVVASDFKELANHKGIELHITDQTDKAIINCDKDKIKKVFNNLISNALKHTNHGGKIELILYPIKNHNLSISIKDNGEGISKEHLPHIFDRFYRTDTQAKGTGIGLALCKELIELHNGHIFATSKLGIGSTFTIEFPIHQQHIRKEQLETPQCSIDEQKHSADEITPHQKTILLVEDHNELRHYLNDILSDVFTVIEAADGADGILKAEQYAPDLILSDIMMPFKDGLELTQHIKTHLPTSHIPIILLTAKSAIEHKIVGLQQGADDYLSKPFDDIELIERCKNMINQREKLKKIFSENYFVNTQKVTNNNLDKMFLEKAVVIIENNMQNPNFTVELFSKELGMNRTSVHLKLKALTDKNTSQFIKSIRLKKAAQLLQDTTMPIGEILDECGFGSRETFNKAFRNQFKLTPTAFRKTDGFISQD